MGGRAAARKLRARAPARGRVQHAALDPRRWLDPRNSIGLNADIGGRVAHVLGRAAAIVSTLDLIGDGLTLFVGPDWDGCAPRGHPGLPPATVERLDAIAARGLGLSTAGSLLARPDGYPVALFNDVGQEHRAATLEEEHECSEIIQST